MGRFVIKRRLGAGAMGTVYEAHDPDLNRKVALKIVRESGQADSLRLLREAQALAQLQHPNVVVIHDVGVTEDGVFIAMELVDGENLREHFARGALSWKLALALYIQAGRGLEAAHGKSIVHRDFKPANVLLDREGRVRVTDFGLARVVTDEGADDGVVDDRGRSRARPSAANAVTATTSQSADLAAPRNAEAELLGAPLTHEGALLGTPRYMAPEQHARRAATARSDQYSFCVCLWEAVFGEHPFPHGHEPSTLPLGSQRKVPRWLVRALERGLAFDPGRRHPTMAALLDALERAPRIRRRAWTVGAVAVALAVFGAASLSLGARSLPDPCNSIASLRPWNAETRMATRAAFVATAVPFAAQVHDKIASRLDDYAARWHAMRVENCRVTRIERTQSEELFERRNLCLDRREDEVGALIAAMRVIPSDRVEKAIDAMENLGDLHACSDSDALFRSAPLPQDSVRAERVRELEREIADVEAQNSIGRPEDRSAKVEELFAKARELEYRPALVRALDLKVDLAWDSDRWKELVDLTHEQLVVAEAAGDDRARFRAYTMLLEVNGARLQRYDDATQAGRLAEALLHRFGDEPELSAKLRCAQCMAEWYRGNFLESLRFAKACVADRERVVPRDEGAIGRALLRQAVVETELKRFEDGLVTLARTVELLERAYGERHPVVALALNIQGEAHHALDRLDLAEAAFRRAISILEESRSESSNLSRVMQTYANMLLDQEKYEEATAIYRRVLAVQERTMGPTNNRTAAALDMLGKALALSGKLEEGEALGLRAIAIREANGSGDHPEQATSWRILGGQYRRVKQYKKSSEAYARSLRILEGKYGKSHPLLVSSLLGVAEAELYLGNAKVARAHVERALPHIDAPEVRSYRALLQFLLARALWATAADRPRARELADTAFELASTEADHELVSEIEAWRKTHAAR